MKDIRAFIPDTEGCYLVVRGYKDPVKVDERYLEIQKLWDECGL